MPLRNNSLRNIMHTLLVSTLCTLGLTGVRADTLNVPAQYPTIQAGVDAAVAGDTVLIADGTYTGVGNYAIDFKGKDLTVKSSGGAAVCILDCQKAGRGFYLHTGETVASRIDGFTIKNGSDTNYGGGIYITSQGTVANCILSGNTATHRVVTFDQDYYYIGKGGGLCGGTAINCIFSGNNSPDGGGMSGGTATNCMFRGNNADVGGGMSGGTATNCTFDGNTGSNSGSYLFSGENTIGGMSNGTAINCLFIHNSATHIAAMYGGIATNCTFTENKSGIYRYGLGSVSGNAIARVKATNCILWNNSPAGSSIGGSNTITYSDTDKTVAGVGNTSFDPGFVNAAAGNYHLLATSPCIDGGTTAGLSLPATDLDGNPRLLGRAPDMGAYETPNTSLAFTALYARNDTSGQNSFRQLFRNTLLRAATLPTVTDLHWKMATAADLFHQGNTDLIWHNDTTGDVVYWEVQDETLLTSGYIQTVKDLNWKIVGACDLFHQGNTDILWQNSATGDIVYWDMKGATIAGSGYLNTVSDLNWEIVAIADLFQNAHSDFIWQNASSGEVVYWEMNGTSQVSSGYIGAVPDHNWTLVGSADLFRQSHTDLIWQHGSTGDVVYWDLTGAKLMGSGYLFTMPDPQMKIHAIR